MNPEPKNVMFDARLGAAGSFEQYMEHVPTAFAVTRGVEHTLVYTNVAFRNLVLRDSPLLVGNSILTAFVSSDAATLGALLDRGFRTGAVLRNRRVGSSDGGVLPLSCTVWPDLDVNGAAQHLVIEMRPATQGELALVIQREVAERLLLAALREQDAAKVAEELRRAAAFLASESRRLVESLDEAATLVAMKKMSLPYLGDWCIVDTLDDDDTMHRLAVIHPDPAKQAILEDIEGRWIPDLDDVFGLPAALRSATPTVITDDVNAALLNAAQHPDVGWALRELGVGPLLTVPLTIRDRLIGAVTFVGGRQGRPFTQEDLTMATDLASRSAMALDRARAYGEAIELKLRAESATRAKSAFMDMMSHELRTPLNAIGGYVDLIDMGIHGPVTDAQHVDLGRIRTNQRYLMGLISDLLNLTRVGSGHLAYHDADVNACDILAAAVALVEPLIAQRGLAMDSIVCDPAIVARGDAEKITQILVNLLSNAIKFTLPGGRLTIDGLATVDEVQLRIADTGIGIPAHKLDAIFEPFIQVKGTAIGLEGGIGLGLAISRGLARAMGGDLTVESTLRQGSRFILSLPVAPSAGEGLE